MPLAITACGMRKQSDACMLNEGQRVFAESVGKQSPHRSHFEFPYVPVLKASASELDIALLL